MLLKLETTPTCTHGVLNSTGHDKWQCALCGKELTELDLIDQRNERRRQARAERAEKAK